MNNEKILILANDDVGLYKFRKELIIRFLEQNKKVYISLPDGKYVEKLVDMGCEFIATKIERRGTNFLRDLLLFFKYCNILKKIKPGCTITYTIKPNVYGGIACRICRVPCVINITGLGTAFQKEGLLQDVVAWLYRISCKKAKAVLFENNFNREVFLKKKITRKEKTHVLNGAGVNVSEYAFCEYPEDDSELHFLFIGRVMKEKGIEELFQAAEALKKDYNNIVIDIVGPYEEDYKDATQRLMGKNIVRYYGYQQDVIPFIQKSHCLVLPSYHEGMANVILEAGAMGRPLIVSDIPGCREAVDEGYNGFLCAKADVDSLLDKMRKFIALNYDEKKKMGEMSRRLIAEKFDRKDVVDKTLAILKL